MAREVDVPIWPSASGMAVHGSRTFLAAFWTTGTDDAVVSQLTVRRLLTPRVGPTISAVTAFRILSKLTSAASRPELPPVLPRWRATQSATARPAAPCREGTRKTSCWATNSAAPKSAKPVKEEKEVNSKMLLDLQLNYCECIYESVKYVYCIMNWYYINCFKYHSI